MSICGLLLYPLLFSSRECRKWALSSECKTDQNDLTDWMYFLLSNLMEETNPNAKVLNANT